MNEQPDPEAGHQFAHIAPVPPLIVGTVQQRQILGRAMTEHIHARQQIAVGMPHQAGAAQTGAGKAMTTILRVEIVHHRSRHRPGAESAAATAAPLHRLHLQRIFRIRAQSGDRHRTPGHRLPEDSGTPRRLRNRHRIPVAARRQPIRRHPGAGRRQTANIHLSAIKQRRAVGRYNPS